MSVVLDFLEGLSDSLSIHAVKGYVTTISHMHQLVDQNRLSCHPLVKNGLSGLAALKGVYRLIVPPWCLEFVLAALKKPPFSHAQDSHDHIRQKNLQTAEPVLRRAIYPTYC